MGPRRGDVFWASIPEVGDKPVLVVSSDTLNRALSEVTAVRVTAVERERALPTYVVLRNEEVPDLPFASFVLCHSLYTLPKRALRARAGSLTPGRMVEVEEALRFALDL